MPSGDSGVSCSCNAPAGIRRLRFAGSPKFHFWWMRFRSQIRGRDRQPRQRWQSTLLNLASYGTDNATARGAAAPNFSEGDAMGADKMHHARGAEAPHFPSLGNSCIEWPPVATSNLMTFVDTGPIFKTEMQSSFCASGMAARMLITLRTQMRSPATARDARELALRVLKSSSIPMRSLRME